MKVIETNIPGVVLLEPTFLGDARGYFAEIWKEQPQGPAPFDTHFVQQNESCSQQGVLRGLHFQRVPFAQAKLIRVLSGAIYDVAVDIRKSSPTFLQWVGAEISAENRRQIFIPRGFAHGFVALTDNTVINYLTDNPYAPTSEGAIRYDDPALNIQWPLDPATRLVSAKDANAPHSAQADLFD